MFYKIFASNIIIFSLSILAQLLFSNFVVHISNNSVILGLGVLPIVWLNNGIPKMFSLLYAFIIGFILDLLFYTPGLHSATLVAVAFARQYILFFLFRNSNLQNRPRIFAQGFPYVIYLFLCFLVYFFIFTLLEYWSISQALQHIGKTLLNILVNMGLCLLLELLLFSSERRKYSNFNQ